jgi:plasmid stability protein
MAGVKATFQLPEDTLAYVRQTAEAHGLSMGDVVRQALRQSKEFDDRRASGGRVIVEQPDGARIEIVPAR